jgi:hypothetical protein
MHWRVQLRQSLFIDGQRKRVVTRFCVARIPGWDNSCNEVKTLRRNGFGTNGHTISPEMSQYNGTLLSGKRIFLRRSALVPELIILRNSASLSCAAASV